MHGIDDAFRCRWVSRQSRLLCFLNRNSEMFALGSRVCSSVNRSRRRYATNSWSKVAELTSTVSTPRRMKPSRVLAAWSEPTNSRQTTSTSSRFLLLPGLEEAERLVALRRDNPCWRRASRTRACISLGSRKSSSGRGLRPRLRPGSWLVIH